MRGKQTILQNRRLKYTFFYNDRARKPNHICNWKPQSSYIWSRSSRLVNTGLSEAICISSSSEWALWFNGQPHLVWKTGWLNTESCWKRSNSWLMRSARRSAQSVCGVLALQILTSISYIQKNNKTIHSIFRIKEKIKSYSLHL